MALRLPARNWLNGLAAVALAGFAWSAEPARAESIFGLFSFDVSPAEVAANINRHGYVIRSSIVRRGDVYVADVSGPSGEMERLIIDAHSGRLAQRYAWRGDLNRPDLRHYPAPGGMFAPEPRPEVDVGVARVRPEEMQPSDTELRALRQRQTAYGGDARTPLTNVLPTPETKPVEKAKPKLARPKPAPSSSTEASVNPSASPSTAPASSEVTTAPAAVAPTPSPSEAAKPAAPTKSEVASTTPSERPAAPAAAPVLPAPAPAAPPAPTKKSINDIPVAPLD